MPLASAARLKKAPSEPLVVKGESLVQPKGRRLSIDKNGEDKKGEMLERRRSSSMGRRVSMTAEKEKVEEHIHRTEPHSSCDGCGKVHHGLLQLQYTQSLEQQIALLELENNHLRTAPQQPAQSSGCHSHLPPPLPHSRPPPFHPPPPSSSHSHYSHPPPSIGGGGQGSFGGPQSSFVSHQSHHGQQQHFQRPGAAPPLWNEMIPEVRESPPMSSERRERSEETREDRSREERRTEERMRSSDTELLHRLEEYSQKLLGLERKLKEKMRETRSKEESIASLQSRLRELEGNLNQKTDADAQQKRALMEEILELQRRLDELTPILAQKEGMIARLESEKDEMMMEMRRLQGENSHLQIRMSDRSREDSMRIEQEDERRRERQRMEMIVREKEGEIEAGRSRDRMHIEEMARMKREVREEEIKSTQQKAILDKLTEENGKLVKECSRLAAEVSRLEIRAEHAERDNQLRQSEKEASRDLAELKERENSLRIELTQAQEALHAERECSTLLQNQLKEGSSREHEIRDARNRMERELEALHALSKSLSAENTTLRQEKLSQEEQLDAIKLKLLEKDRNLHEKMEALREAERRYEDALARVEEESTGQRQRTIELEELGQKLKDLSESLPRSTHNSATRSSTSKEAISSRSQEHHRSVEITQTQSSAHSRTVGQCVIPPIQSIQSYQSKASIDEVIEMTRSALGTRHH